MEQHLALSCPSAPHDMPGATVFGVVLGDERTPEVAYFAKRAALDTALNLRGGGIGPDHALRFTAPCAASGCGQWSGGGCRLGRDMVARLQPVVDAAPACATRATCR